MSYRKIFIFIPIILFSFFIYRVNSTLIFVGIGESMLPGIKNKAVLSLRPTQNFQRHEIYGVSFNERLNPLEKSFMKDPSTISLKRLVGMPGDTLTFDSYIGNLISINGINETYSRQEILACRSKLKQNSNTKTCEFKVQFAALSYGVILHASSVMGQRNILNQLLTAKHMRYLQKQPLIKERFVTFQLGPDEYFFVSDNRAIGFDSRYCGPIGSKEILYKLFRILPERTK